MLSAFFYVEMGFSGRVILGPLALICFIANLFALRMANGAVFHLVLRRFSNEIRVMTGEDSQTGRIDELNAAKPDYFVDIYPDPARGLRIANGDPALLITRSGLTVVEAGLSRDSRLDTPFVPFHRWDADSGNALTNAVLDPVFRIPELKVCAVRIERASVADFASEQFLTNALH